LKFQIIINLVNIETVYKISLQIIDIQTFWKESIYNIYYVFDFMSN